MCTYTDAHTQTVLFYITISPLLSMVAHSVVHRAKRSGILHSNVELLGKSCMLTVQLKTFGYKEDCMIYWW